MGAMHQKIAIFKEENSVCSGTKFSKITKWRDFLDGHKMALTTKNLKLKNKTCQEISKITKWHYDLDGHKMAPVLDGLTLKFKNTHVIIIIHKFIFWDSWQKLVISGGGDKQFRKTH